MDSVEEKKPKEEKPKFVVRTPTDVQRIRLERLMKNPVCKKIENIFLKILQFHENLLNNYSKKKSIFQH